MKTNTIILLVTLYCTSSVMCMKRSDNKEIDGEWEMAKLAALNRVSSKKMKLTELQEEALSAESKSNLKKAYMNLLASVVLEYPQGDPNRLNVVFDSSRMNTLCATYLHCKDEEKAYSLKCEEEEKAHREKERVHKERLICQLAHQHAILWDQIRQMTGRPIFNVLSDEYHALTDQLNALAPDWRSIVACKNEESERKRLSTTQDEQPQHLDMTTASKSSDT